MGKGDNKTKKGKIRNHSYGVKRPSNSTIRATKREAKGIFIEPNALKKVIS